MSNRKGDTQEIYEKRRMQDGKQAKEKIPMKPESRSKLFACLAYIPFVWIVSYFAERKNEFVRFHVKQGMKLTLLTLVVGAVAENLNAFFSWIFSYSVPTPTPEDLSHVTTGVNSVGQTLCIIVAFVATIILVSYALYGVIAAARGKMAELPLLGKQKREKDENQDQQS